MPKPELEFFPAASVEWTPVSPGVWERVLERTQSMAQQAGELDWVASIDSTIVRVHQHGATLPRPTGGLDELQEIRGRAG